MSPLAFGIEREQLWASLRVEVAETGHSTNVTPGGSFWIDTEVPATLGRVTLHFVSDTLMLEAKTRALRLRLNRNDDPVDLQVDVPMIPALVARPVYNGRVITPADLKDPVVQEEFLRQLSETVGRLAGPPPLASSGFTVFSDVGIEGDVGDVQQGYSWGQR